MPNEEPVVKAAAYVEDLATLWRAATLDERRAILLTALDAVYIDMDTRRLVAVQPKADFLPLLAAASPTWGLAGKSWLLGDPEGNRGVLAQTRLAT